MTKFNKETEEILSDPEAMQAIEEALDDVANGDVEPLENDCAN